MASSIFLLPAAARRLCLWAFLGWGWCSPIALHGQHRRGHSGRTCERSCDVVVGRVTLETQGDEKVDLRRPRLFSRRRRRSRLCEGPSEVTLRSSRNGGFSPFNQPTTRHHFAWFGFGFTWNMSRLGVHTPQIEGSIYLRCRCEKTHYTPCV